MHFVLNRLSDSITGVHSFSGFVSLVFDIPSCLAQTYVLIGSGLVDVSSEITRRGAGPCYPPWRW